MKIENIIISNEDIINKTAKITFELKEVTIASSVFIKINDNEYQEIFTEKTDEVLNYDVKDLQYGINNVCLKLSNEGEEYITEPFLIKLKINPTIENLNCIYTDSTGKYRLQFDLLGDENFKYIVYLKIDDEEYVEMVNNQVMGNLIIESTNTMGTHTIGVKVTDGYDEFEIEDFEIEIKNIVPILSKILATDFTNNSCIIHYATNDVESSLTHKIMIDGQDYTDINPSSTGCLYSYQVSIGEGIHTVNIRVSDGIDIVTSEDFTFEIFSSSTDGKELLRQSKVRYDNAYNGLKTIIVSVIEDLKFNYDIENPMIQKAHENYRVEYSNFNKIAQQSVDIIGTNKVSSSKEDLMNQISEIEGAVGNLEGVMNSTFKDGILSDNEKNSLRDSIHLVEKEKIDIDSDYNSLYNNEDLLDPSKSNLQTAYNGFNTAHTQLITALNEIINKGSIIDDTDKNKADTAFENWRNAIGEYRNKSLEAVDSIAKKKMDESVSESKAYTNSQIQLLEDSISLKVEEGIQASDLSGQVTQNSQNIAELQITANGITSTVSSNYSDLNNKISSANSLIQQNADSISSKVDKNGIISSINQSSESVTINARKINLTGAVTFSSFDSSTQNTINNASSNASSALSTANSAYNKADSVEDTANTAYNWADTAWDRSYDNMQTLDAWAYDSSRTYIDGGVIRTGTIYVDHLSSNNANPIIRLFVGNGGSCAIDATKYNEQGIGDAIRLKWDDVNYVRISKNSAQWYCTNTGEHAYMTFTGDMNGWVISGNGVSLTTTSSGLYVNNTLVSLNGHTHSGYASSSHSHSGYASSSHSHSGYASSSHTHDVISYSNDRVECYGGYVYFKAGSCTMRFDEGASEYGWNYKLAPTLGGVDLGNGSSWQMWRDIYCESCFESSDVKFKENIIYLDEMLVYGLSDEIETPFLDFIKNDFKPALYNFKPQREEEEGYRIYDEHIGFIANDIMNTEVGKTFVYDDTEIIKDGSLKFSGTGYTTVVARALQEEVRLRDTQIARLEARIKELEDKIDSNK